MNIPAFTQLILSHFQHTPTDCQTDTIKKLAEFALSGETESLFILRGYAGTGKTSVVSALISAMKDINRPVVLLAPTGRAAKVLSDYSNLPAYTIHRWIYRQNIAGEVGGKFSMNYNKYRDALFVVDEASMITDFQAEGSFGSGNLLNDLLEYVYDGTVGCQVLFVGDNAQLPPIGRDYSPALESSLMKTMGFSVYESLLNSVVRQKIDSGILYNATMLRVKLYDAAAVTVFPELETDGYKDIMKITSETLIEDIASAYSKYGEDDTIIITRSNKRANQFNFGIRNQVLDKEDELSSGDLIMIVKNNYFWAQNIEGLDFIANGDTARVKRVRRTTELYGFRFADVEIILPDYDTEFEVKVLLDTLSSDSPSLSQEQMANLFSAVEEDYMDIPDLRARRKKMRQDPYLNALQIKFAYCVTCHKAQGGQWSAVFLDNGYLTTDMINYEYYRWLYTAITRATQRVYLLNWHVYDTNR